MSNEPIGCGVSWLWLLPENHVFLSACAEHDLDFDRRAAGELDEPTSEYADLRFYGRMLEIAGSSIKLRLLAWFMYTVARTYGRFRWPDPPMPGA